MSESDQICLERDPYNKFDSNAVKVCVVINGERKQIGFLAKDLASEISPKLRRGVNFKATVNSCGIWNERPFCEIEVEEMTSTQILDKPLPNSAPAPRSVPPRPIPPRTMTPKAVAQPSIPNKVLSNPVHISTPRSSNLKNSSNINITSKTNNSGCLGIIAVLVIVISALIVL